MSLLNSAALWGLVALVVPVVVHLQRRRKSQVVEWAAMRFLTASLASRQRGMTLEHLLLLFCRCALFVVFLLAMARPVVGSVLSLHWLMLVAVSSSGLLALAYAVVSTSARRPRLLAAAAASILLGAAVWILVAGADRGGGPLGESRDLAIVIDGTTSMKIAVDGRTNFDHAVDEAEKLVDQLSGDSTVSIVLAGPVNAVVGESPYRNLNRASRALRQLRAPGGGVNLTEAIDEASRLVKQGTNRNKQVVVLSDSQLNTWQSVVDEWNGEAQETSTEYFAKVIGAPSRLDNLGVVRIVVDSATPTTSQSVPILVEIVNNGTTTVRDRALKLAVDEREISTKPVPQLEPGARVTVRCTHKFVRSGRRLVSAIISDGDQLTDDNRSDQVVSVLDKLPVLIVDGNRTAKRFSRSATFVQLALDPSSHTRQDDRPIVNAGGTQSGGAVRATVVDAADFSRMTELDEYQVVILCDVVRLPAHAAARLSAFVHGGGGLWVIPGTEADTDFYQGWKSALTKTSLLPVQIKRQVTTRPDELHTEQLRLDVDSVSHVALDGMMERGEHDLSELAVSTYWEIEHSENSSLFQQPASPVQYAARLTNGDPLLVEHSVGRGRVLLQTIALNPSENNLIARVSFPVTTHLLTHHLALQDQFDFNLSPSRNLTLELASEDAEQLSVGQVQLVTPLGKKRSVAVSGDASRKVIDVGFAAAPGAYQFLPVAQSPGPLVILGDAHEFDLTSVTEQKRKRWEEQTGIRWVDDLQQLTSHTHAVEGGVEIWRYLLFSALCLLVFEVLLTHWIRARRLVSDEASSILSGAG